MMVSFFSQRYLRRAKKTPGIIFFPSNSVLGFGTVGYVYKAKLASSGEYVVLKLFAQPSKGHIYH